MAEKETAARASRPPEVTVTFVVPPVSGHRRGRLTDVVPRGARKAVGATLALAALGSIVAVALQTSQTTRPAGERGAQVRGAERAVVADRAAIAARSAIAGAFGYPYPRRCLTITISAENPDFARASVDRTAGCARYRGYLNASFHLVDGGWRLVLDEGQLFVPNRLLTPCRCTSSTLR
jgi:hypothetical protein